MEIISNELQTDDCNYKNEKSGTYKIIEFVKALVTTKGFFAEMLCFKIISYLFASPFLNITISNLFVYGICLLIVCLYSKIKELLALERNKKLKENYETAHIIIHYGAFIYLTYSAIFDVISLILYFTSKYYNIDLRTIKDEIITVLTS